jgi:hypothetical protein
VLLISNTKLYYVKKCTTKTTKITKTIETTKTTKTTKTIKLLHSSLRINTFFNNKLSNYKV